MPRKKKTVAELYGELTGNDYYFSVAERWNWIDLPIMTFAAVLKFTGLPKGRIESYSRRGLWELDYHGYQPQSGSGHHVLYSPRSVLKLIAIDRLSEAGAWTECLQESFSKNRQFDLILNGYQAGSYRDSKTYDPDRTLTLNDGNARYFRQHGRSVPSLPGDPSYVCGPPPDDWVQLTFDVQAFLRDIMPRLIRFFADEGVLLKDGG